MTISEQWHKCTGCRQLKTINFKPKEKEKDFKCECGKISKVKCSIFGQQTK